MAASVPVVEPPTPPNNPDPEPPPPAPTALIVMLVTPAGIVKLVVAPVYEKEAVVVAPGIALSITLADAPLPVTVVLVAVPALKSLSDVCVRESVVVASVTLLAPAIMLLEVANCIVLVAELLRTPFVDPPLQLLWVKTYVTASATFRLTVHKTKIEKIASAIEKIFHRTCFVSTIYKRRNIVSLHLS